MEKPKTGWDDGQNIGYKTAMPDGVWIIPTCGKTCFCEKNIQMEKPLGELKC